MNLNDLYKKVSVIPIGDFPPSALSGLLHGYISIYSIVRVNPWLVANGISMNGFVK